MSFSLNDLPRAVKPFVALHFQRVKNDVLPSAYNRIMDQIYNDPQFIAFNKTLFSREIISRCTGHGVNANTIQNIHKSLLQAQSQFQSITPGQPGSQQQFQLIISTNRSFSTTASGGVNPSRSLHGNTSRNRPGSRSILHHSRRGFKFKRYFPPGRFSYFKGFIDILSPFRTLSNRLRPYQFKIKRLWPGRYLQVMLYLLQFMFFIFVLMYFIERDPNYSTGWDSPEDANWGYFIRQDFSRRPTAHYVELYRKKRNFKKSDRNPNRYEEDYVEIDRGRQWTFMNPTTYFPKGRGIWPFRRFPMYSGDIMDLREEDNPQRRQANYNHYWWFRFFKRGRKRRAFKLRGQGKYELGLNTDYYFTKTHDERRWTTRFPISDENPPEDTMPYMGKY